MQAPVQKYWLVMDLDWKQVCLIENTQDKNPPKKRSQTLFCTNSFLIFDVEKLDFFAYF